MGGQTMANYVYLNNYSKQGKLGISKDVFTQLVNEVISKIDGVTTAKKLSKKNHIFHLNKPVRIDIRHDIVHVRISIDVAKGNDLQKVINRIQKDVVNNLLVLTEQVPFDVQVKVESII